MPPKRKDAILFASPNDAEFEWLKEVFRWRDVSLFHAHTSDEALDRLRSLSDLPVVIVDRDLPAGGWRHLLSHIGQIPNSPLVVVASRVADDRLWAEVLNLGGFDVLATPFSRREVTHVVETARDNWLRSRQPAA